MENYSIVIFILAIMIGLTAIAEKIKLPYPIVLIVAGIAIGLIPAMPAITLNPDIIMLIFLPPLLYDAAFNISFQEFRTHISTISSLAIGLVFITTAGIAVMAYYLIPGITWPLAFTLGAILSATDAVAAIGITKGLGLSHHTTTILEGESLVNDASALVAYRFAVAAVTGMAFVWWKASLQFILLLAGGLVVGLVMGKLLAFTLRWFRNNHLVVISLMILMPFVTYLLAEECHVSGVIAVVILGLSMSRLSRKKFPDNIQQQSRNFWEIAIFLLNGLIFILIGLQFPIVLKNISTTQILPNIGYAFLITLAVFFIRLARVFLQQLNLQRGFRYKRGHIKEEALLDFKSSIIISWSGMRGIVSLAIAIGLPVTLDNGLPFPMRSTIIFISVAVVLFTLLGQGLTLPWVVKQLDKTA
ncbi:Na+/H+ antiporter [Chitinophaga nivalis]|uniref:Na+/H+ antiporter n=1 Tax=Chitinophaga nivalis TaxID=2991709 RepID=A0ABT3IM16_9BACT|nr:Na+/H+ antiporter [Chitinophaga nivalis]MCW3465296.1 Na+/H+ antiporter [Chitinophaga nivalis]MCW3485012.1 Na+/H+ antiporter [Chitinophaga nivalis]